MSASSLALASASPDQGLIRDSLVVLPTEETTEQDLLAGLARQAAAEHSRGETEDWKKN